MKIWFIYFVIGLFASAFGALAGLGGGVIIKPVLDLLGYYDVGTIGVLSAATVLSMTCVSLLSSIKTDIKINMRQSRSEEHTSELQSRGHLVCRLLLEKKKQ